MFPIEHPETVMLIHNEMVRREMRRNSPDDYREQRGPDLPRGPITGIREWTGRLLFAAGTWISPGQRSQPEKPTGVGMTVSAGRNR